MKATFRPLNWVGPQTPAKERRSRWTFKADWSDTLTLLASELKALGAYNIVIEADFSEQDIRLDGLPRANARQPKFPGIRVAFESTKAGSLVYQTDTCVDWQHNVRSIALGLQALRAVDRYGITSRHEQYTGFKAIGSGTALGQTSVPPRFANADEAAAFLRSEPVLGIEGGDGLTLRRAWHMAVMNHHPDRNPGGTLWDEIETAQQIVQKAGLM